MKFFCLILFIPIILSNHKPATNDKINIAIKTGYVDALAEYIGEEMDLALNNENAIVSKKEAITKLKAFFHEHKPLSFQILHQGKSAREMQYAIGKLETIKGDFRVSIYTKMENGKEIIKQLSFDKE